MNNLIKAFLTCSVVAALQQVGQAQITFSSSSSTTSWAGAPIYTSLPNSALFGATTGQGDPTITGATGVLGETFTPSSSFTLSSFSLLMRISTAGTYAVDIYDLGPAGTVSVTSSTASYTPSSSPLLAFTMPFAASGEVQGKFTVGGVFAGKISFAANEEYTLEVLTPSGNGPNGFLWYRSSTADPGGQMFSGGSSTGIRDTLAENGQASGAPMTGALAFYSVPEPSTFALFGIALAGGALARRRKN